MFAFIPFVFADSEEMQTARRITPAPDYCGKQKGVRKTAHTRKLQYFPFCWEKLLPSVVIRVIVSLVLLRRRQGRCTKRQAVSYTIPKGGGAYAYYDYFSCIYIHDHDNRKKQKPPPRQVTVSNENEPVRG